MSGNPLLTSISGESALKKNTVNSFALLDPSYESSDEESLSDTETEQDASILPGPGNDKPITDSWEMPDFADRYHSEMEEDANAIAQIKSLASSFHVPKSSQSHNKEEKGEDVDEDEEDDDDEDEENFEELYLEEPRGSGRRPNPSRPKIPDLRFEQTYRRSIAAADGVWWKILLITLRDQVLITLAQGFAWQLTLVGVKTWRIAAASSGSRTGSTYLGKLSNWWAKINKNQV